MRRLLVVTGYWMVLHEAFACSYRVLDRGMRYVVTLRGSAVLCILQTVPGKNHGSKKESNRIFHHLKVKTDFVKFWSQTGNFTP